MFEHLHLDNFDFWLEVVCAHQAPGGKYLEIPRKERFGGAPVGPAVTAVGGREMSYLPDRC
jgi:hypothetical protein